MTLFKITSCQPFKKIVSQPLYPLSKNVNSPPPLSLTILGNYRVDRADCEPRKSGKFSGNHFHALNSSCVHYLQIFPLFHQSPLRKFFVQEFSIFAREKKDDPTFRLVAYLLNMTCLNLLFLYKFVLINSLNALVSAMPYPLSFILYSPCKEVKLCRLLTKNAYFS